MTVKILFVCTHNGARSRIAEEFAKRFAPVGIVIQSASFESGRIGAIPIAVMKEVGIELPAEPPQSVFERFKNKEVFDIVVAMCDTDSAEQHSIFMASVDLLYAHQTQRLTWSIPNFRSLSGSEEERKAAARNIRDRIKVNVIGLLSQAGFTIRAEFE